MAKLGRRIERLLNARGWLFDEFTPDAYVEGEFADAKLHDLVADAPPVVREAYAGEEDGGSPSYDVIVTLEGQGDAHWHTSQLSGNDLDAFSDRIEGEEHGGGLVHAVESAVPCRIDANAQFLARGCTWADLEIERVTLAHEETERRARDHEHAETRRLQNLGFLPSDDELDNA